MHGTFIQGTKMLFGNAHAFINLNGSPCKEFTMERGGQAGGHIGTLCLLNKRGSPKSHYHESN